MGKITGQCFVGDGCGSENDDEAATAWTRAAEALVKCGATILTVTHSPYSDDSRARGHTHLIGSFDTRLRAEGDKDAKTAVLKVERHKEHDSDGEWGVRLEAQETDEHPGEYSLVPRLDSVVRAKEKGRPRAGSLAREFMEAYTRLASGNTVLNPDGSLTDKVEVSAIRDDLKQRGFVDADDAGHVTSTGRSIFGRTKKELLQAGRLAEMDGWIWKP